MTKKNIKVCLTFAKIILMSPKMKRAEAAFLL